MKLMTGILAVAIAIATATGAAFGQNPDAIDNARSTEKSLQQIKTNQTNQAPAATDGTAPQATEPATGQAADAKPHDAFVPKHKPVALKAKAAKPAAKTPAATSKIAATEKPAAPGKTADPAKAAKPEEKKWAMNGKRDPFFSPVAQQTTTSGCSTGKKCLEIGQINVRGVVKSEAGFIAVVTNSLNKAYFLHENDPVFNGYVVKITGDSVVFQESFQDKLGKALTREVVKKIVTPAV
jgi:Tfp pilus assembly protein PilP